ncbi:MAG: hypothetical protein Greene041619_622 [Candidatus Peregrinibacteria bacterium Greene0416_19]|nr:MAG: hypothetical protein Greene041619_622 [Candidatus Peregrinibacteria bacterium Greene0416_19]
MKVSIALKSQLDDPPSKQMIPNGKGKCEIELRAFVYQHDCWAYFLHNKNLKPCVSYSHLPLFKYWRQHVEATTWKYQGVITKRGREKSLIRKYAKMIGACESLAESYWSDVNFVYDTLVLCLRLIADREGKKIFAPKDKENLLDWADRVPAEWKEVWMHMRDRLVIAKLEQWKSENRKSGAHART